MIGDGKLHPFFVFMRKLLFDPDRTPVAQLVEHKDYEPEVPSHDPCSQMTVGR